MAKSDEKDQDGGNAGRSGGSAEGGQVSPAEAGAPATPSDDAVTEAARVAALENVHERFDRAEAMAETPQRVTDVNEAAALRTYSDPPPVRNVPAELDAAVTDDTLGPKVSTPDDETE